MPSAVNFLRVLPSESARLPLGFDLERQTLAMIDHPAIAKVFDADSTAEGQPYRRTTKVVVRKLPTQSTY